MLRTRYIMMWEDGVEQTSQFLVFSTFAGTDLPIESSVFSKEKHECPTSTHDKHNIGARWNLNSQCVNRIVCTAAGTCVLYKCRENVFVYTQNFLRRTIITICVRRLFIKRCTLVYIVNSWNKVHCSHNQTSRIVVQFVTTNYI